MPVYKGVLTLDDNGPDTPTVHLFDYCSEDDHQATKSSYRKQLIALESCIYLGRRTLANIKAQDEARNKERKEQQQEKQQQQEQEQEQQQDQQKQNTEGTEAKNGASDPTNDKTEKEEEEKVKEKDKQKKDKKERVKEYLKEGQEFQAYVLKCPNGPYDYAMKVWDKGRAAPPEEGYPREGQEEAAVVVDRAGDLLTVACGPNIAFARKKTFLCAGVDPDDLSLPFARLKVSLRRLQEREALVPAAGWEATPTQVVVPPADVY